MTIGRLESYTAAGTGVPRPGGIVQRICVQNVGPNPDRDRGACVLEQDTLP